MRSRYSAYVLGLKEYLLATWHSTTRPTPQALDHASDSRTTWLGLKVSAHVATGNDTAEVEFIARYREGGARAKRLHERSRFVREEGRWFYLDGSFDSSG